VDEEASTSNILQKALEAFALLPVTLHSYTLLLKHYYTFIFFFQRLTCRSLSFSAHLTTCNEDCFFVLFLFCTRYLICALHTSSQLNS